MKKKQSRNLVLLIIPNFHSSLIKKTSGILSWSFQNTHSKCSICSWRGWEENFALDGRWGAAYEWEQVVYGPSVLLVSQAQWTNWTVVLNQYLVWFCCISCLYWPKVSDRALESCSRVKAASCGWLHLRGWQLGSLAKAKIWVLLNVSNKL